MFGHDPQGEPAFTHTLLPQVRQLKEQANAYKHFVQEAGHIAADMEAMLEGMRQLDPHPVAVVSAQHMVLFLQRHAEYDEAIDRLLKQIDRTTLKEEKLRITGEARNMLTPSIELGSFSAQETKDALRRCREELYSLTPSDDESRQSTADYFATTSNTLADRLDTAIHTLTTQIEALKNADERKR